jgi:hypothetical protein
VPLSYFKFLNSGFDKYKTTEQISQEKADPSVLGSVKFHQFVAWRPMAPLWFCHDGDKACCKTENALRRQS